MSRLGPLGLVVLVLLALSVSTLVGTIFDNTHRTAYAVTTIVSHALLVAFGYTAARRRYGPRP